MWILFIKRREKNLILSSIMAGVLLFSLITSPSSTTQAAVIANYPYVQISSNEEEGSYSSVVMSSDTNPNGTSKKNATQITNQENNSNMTEVFASNNSVVFKNEFNTKKIFPFNTTLANITSGNSASVQGASEITGDFNGDGFEDKAIGVPREDVDSAIGTVNDAGAVHIIYGSSGGLSTTAVLPDQLWTQDSPGILPGPDLTEVDDRFGSSLSSGDFNGDGKDDLAIGVPAEDIHSNTPFGRDAGMVHVIYGSIEGLSTTSVRSAQAFIESILSNGVSESFDEFGASLSSGDYNGDGKDDLAIGVPAEDLETMSDTGKVHVLHGSADGLHTRPHPGAMFSQGFENVDEEEETLDRFGSSLSSGDYNGDGKDDLAIGVPDEGSALVHRTPQCDVQGVACYSVVHVIYGSSSGLSATSPVADQLWMQGVGGIDEFGEERDSFGGSLSSGDFNGDGKDDLAIGAPGENIPGDVAGDVILDVGKVHVIYGSSSGLSTSPIADQLWQQGQNGLDDVAEEGDLFG